MKLRMIVMATVLVGAFGITPGQEPSARAATTISFWARASDQVYARPVVRAYNASHTPQVTLTLIPDGQFGSRFGAAVAADTAPDVVALDLITVPAVVAAHELTAITTRAHGLPFFNELSPAHIRLATYRNQLYGVPFSGGGSVLLYNKGLFQQAGLNPDQPPTTWAEIEQDAEKITDLGHGNYGYYIAGDNSGWNAYTFLPLIWASGGSLLTPDGTRATLTSSPQLKAALTFYRRLWTEHLAQPNAQGADGSVVDAFGQGTIGMAGGGPSEFSYLRDTYPHLDFGATYLPGMNGGWSSFAGGDTIAIPRGSRHSVAAWNFITWCLTPSVQVDQFSRHGSIPVRTDLAINHYTKLDQALEITALAVAHAQAPYSLHYNELFNDQNSPWLALIRQAVFGGQIDRAIARAQQRFTRILSRE